jgi:hypothetical protein
MVFDWNEHYKQGGMSGEPEDYKISRGWKQNIIKKYCDLSKDSIIDIGCGDLQFWDEKLPKYYTGVDISPTIVEINKNKYPDALFICSNAALTLNISSDAVVCFDMLWHILDDDDYVKILQNMKKYAKTYIIIYTWNRNVFDQTTFKDKIRNVLYHIKNKESILVKPLDNDGGYQKYRNFLKIAKPILSPEFKLIKKYTNTHWTMGTMYIFKR